MPTSSPARGRKLQTQAAVAENASPPFPVKRFTVEEYHGLAEAGILRSGDRYELLNGWIIEKMTHKPPHDVCVDLWSELLNRILPVGWRPRIQSAVTLSTSEPEPDVAIVRGAARDFVARHPGPREIAIVIEVADSSLSRDRYKSSLYARDKVARYWLVNLVDRVIEDHASPSGRGDAAKYRRVEIIQPGEQLSFKLGNRSLIVDVNDILP